MIKQVFKKGRTLKTLTTLSAILLSVSLLLTSCANLGGKVHADDLMKGINPEAVVSKSPDSAFTGQLADFTLEIMKRSFTKEDNTMVSPLSVMLALAMTANGAKGDTLAEMEKVLGGEIALEQLNQYLLAYTSSLPSSKNAKLEIANSIWFRDDENRFKPHESFLQTNADYYRAGAFKSPFNEQTKNDVNNWVDKHTDGMIDEIIDEIESDDIMFLINAIVFDGKWEKRYESSDVYTGDFTALDGSRQDASFMRSEEDLYLEGTNATGFIKPYKDGAYSFAALLPDEGVDFEDWLTSLDAGALLDLLKKPSEEKVTAHLPKFENEFSLEMNDLLIDMGMPLAFDGGLADFSGMGEFSNNIYIGDVLHKTFISVDESGTKAAAVTKVGVKDMAMPMLKTVKLDRPFLYAIIDNITGLPIFIGSIIKMN